MLFAWKGYEQTSVSDIVKQVGVAQGTFYYHFKSKAELLEAMVLDLVAEFQSSLAKVQCDQEESALDKWRSTSKAALEFRLKHQQGLLDVAMPIFHEDNSLLREKLAAATREVNVTVLREIVIQGVAEGVFEVENTMDAAEVIQALSQRLNVRMNEIWFSTPEPEDGLDLALQTIRSFQTSIERLLNAPNGSMPLGDEDAIRSIFVMKPTERGQR